MSLGLFACGAGQSPLNNINITRDETTGDLYVGVEAELQLNQASFPSLTIPLRDRSTGKVYGALSLRPGLNGESYLRFDVNMSEVTDVPVLADPRLPNGTLLPIAGLEEVIALQVQERSRVYVGYSQSNVMLGIAIVLDALDGAAQDVPNANLFFQIGEQHANVKGLVGLFTGDQPGESGVGIFVDVTRQANLFANTLSLSALDSQIEYQTKTRNSVTGVKKIRFLKAIHRESGVSRTLELK